MKFKQFKLQNLEVKSFVTSMDKSQLNQIKGGDTEDNTDVVFSFQDCKATVPPHVPGSDYQVCIEEPTATFN